MNDGFSSRAAYRDGAVRCPGCGEMMRQEAVKDAEIDVCDRCGGLWVDWFDGDVPTIAAQAQAQRARRGASDGFSGPDGPAAPRSGICPRCTRGLSTETYRFPDAAPDELVGDVELLRCSECAGCFVSRASAHLLLDRARMPRTVGLWQAIVDLLMRLVGHPRSSRGDP